MFLGKDLIVWLLLALGGALFAGNLMAVIRPPAAPKLITIRGYIDRRRATMAKTQFCWDVPPLLDAQLTQP